MKMLLKTGLLFCTASLLLFPSCKEDEPTAEELFLAKIGTAWILSSTGVALDDVPVNKVFSGFVLTLTDQSTFTTTNGNSPIWASSGKFTLKKNSSTAGFALVRNDAVEVSVDQLTDTKLVLRFQYVGQPGRTKSVGGEYVFDLIKKP
jgi:hypothetical protein